VTLPAASPGTRVAVAILDLDQHQVTMRCLESIAGGGELPDVVVLLHNGCRPFETDVAAAFGLPIVEVGSEVNLGCAAGRNVLLSLLFDGDMADTCVVLDNDTVVDHSFIGNVRRVCAPTNVWAPVIRSPDGTTWAAGGLFVDGGLPHQIDQPPDGVRAVDWAPGACLVVPRPAWLTSWGFDEALDFYFEDCEWCERVHDSGFPVAVSPELRVTHEANQSLDGPGSVARTRLWARNAMALSLLGSRVVSVPPWRFVVQNLVAAASELATGEGSQAAARLQALLAGTRLGLERRFLPDGAVPRRGRSKRPRKVTLARSSL